MIDSLMSWFYTDASNWVPFWGGGGGGGVGG